MRALEYLQLYFLITVIPLLQRRDQHFCKINIPFSNPTKWTETSPWGTNQHCWILFVALFLTEPFFLAFSSICITDLKIQWGICDMLTWPTIPKFSEENISKYRIAYKNNVVARSHFEPSVGGGWAKCRWWSAFFYFTFYFIFWRVGVHSV